MLKRILCSFLLLTAIFACTSCNRQNNGVTKSDFALDTVVTITIYGMDASEASAIIDDCFREVNRYEKLFSAKDATSELFALNAKHGGVASDELADIITFSLNCSELTDGAFNIAIGSLTEIWDIKKERIPTETEISAAKNAIGSISVDNNRIVFENPNTKIDLGAIAKGYISNKLHDFLVSHGVTSATINLGGNVHCIGEKYGSAPFRIGIQKPFGEIGETIEVVELTDECAITSGAYQRYFEANGKLYHHIIDPNTGIPAESDLSSVTVIAHDAALCDALSTACFVVGRNAATEMISQTEGVRAVFVTTDGEVYFCD